MERELELLRLAGSRFTDLTSELTEQDFARPTPCSEWDAGQLVDHVVGGNWYTLAVLAGESSEGAMATALSLFTADLDRATAAASSTSRQQAAFTQPGVFERSFQHVLGEISGAQVLRLRLHEMLVHGWDLAAAQQADPTIDDELVAWALEELRKHDSLMARHFDFESDRPVGSDPPMIQLLEAFGRSPTRWLVD